MPSGPWQQNAAPSPAGRYDERREVVLRVNKWKSIYCSTRVRPTRSMIRYIRVNIPSVLLPAATARDVTRNEGGSVARMIGLLSIFVVRGRNATYLW
jgi:hypothetical protein